MQELSRRTRTRLLTDIAFAGVMAAAASFSIAAAQAQTQAPTQQDNPAFKMPDELKSRESKEPTPVGESRAAPEPRLPADQTQPPVSGKPLDEPGKELNSAPPEKVEGK
jgi:hypothetical protein